VPLANVFVTDNIPGINPAPVLSGGFNVGDPNHDGLLETGETWMFTATGTAIAGQYSNVGTVTGTPVDFNGNPIPGTTTQTANNPDHYFGAQPNIAIVKLTNGTDNDTGTGPFVPVGSTVTWTYIVTNTGNVTLSNVVVTDDNGTPGNTADDFTVGTVASLAPGASATLTHAGIAAAGQYGNVGSVVGTPVDGGGNPIPGATPPTGSNPDHYFAYSPVTIGDFVWNDLNGNGIQTAGEAGISGVTLTLTGTDFLGNPVTDHATTNGNGAYLFTEQAPGTYTVTVDASNSTGAGALVGYTPTPTLQGSDRSIDSNPNPSGTTPATLPLPGGQSDLTVDFGYYQPVKIGNFVWNDLNGNGVQDAGEPGIPSVTLTLTGTTGAGASVSQTTTTDGNGLYQFTEAPGTYTVAVTTPAGYVATATGQGTAATDSNSSPSGTSPGTLASGGSDQTADFGFYQSVKIGNFVWNDINDNGIQDAGESGVQGVTLTLTGTNGLGQSVTDHATTNSNGGYLFTEAPGTYTVSVDDSNFNVGSALVGYSPSPDIVGSDRTVDSNHNPSGTTPGTLASGGSDLTVDFGFDSPDLDVAKTADAATVDAGATVGFTVTLHNEGLSDAIGVSYSDPLPAGLGNNIVWSIASQSGPTANAFSLDTTTAGSQHLLFSPTVVHPGNTYTVHITGLSTKADADSISLTGTLTNTATLTVGNEVPPDNPNDHSATATITVKDIAIGNFVWSDTNGNGVQDSGEPGIAGVTLTLTGTDSSGHPVTDTTTTNSNGLYQFTEAPGTYTVAVTTPSGYVPTATGKGTTATDSNLSPSGTTPGTLTGGSSDLTVDFGFYQPVSIGNFVWNDLNGNGVQDSGEPGIAGVTLTLTGTTGAGASVTQTTTTDANGLYQFAEPPGMYTVAVTTPSGYVATATGKGTTASDSNVSPSGTTPGALASGGSDQTIDFGFYRPVTIGNFVWNDANANGIQDSGEAGISGVTLTLTGTNGAGVAVTDHATTSGSGGYLFTEVPGTYTVKVDASNFNSGGALANYSASTALIGSDRAVDSNINGGGTSPAALPGGSSDLTVDFGYFRPTTGTPVGHGAAATIGYWHNKNGQALIKGFNGNVNSTALGNWLASTFPNLFGSFHGQTNTQIAADFLTAFGNVGGVQGNTYAQAFANALAIYATDPTLGGGSAAASQGFTVKTGGTGSDTFNVGSNGAAFGVPNNTTLTVLQILTTLNSNYSPTTHLFYGGSQSLTSAANNVTNGINQGGDIALVTDGSNSDFENASLVNVLQPVSTGVLVVAVDDLPAGQAAGQQAAIDAAVASLNGVLTTRGVSLVEIHGDDTVAADVHLHVSDTSAIGGVAQGVLGVMQQGIGEVTIISGWNYYYGGDTSAVGANQYDFETVVMHELGHAIGLGHSTDTGSVMFPYLGTAQARRSLTESDLGLIDQVRDAEAEPLLVAPHGYQFVSTTDSSAGAPVAVQANQMVEPTVALPVQPVASMQTETMVELRSGPQDSRTAVRVDSPREQLFVGGALDHLTGGRDFNVAIGPVGSQTTRSSFIGILADWESNTASSAPNSDGAGSTPIGTTGDTAEAGLPAAVQVDPTAGNGVDASWIRLDAGDADAAATAVTHTVIDPIAGSILALAFTPYGVPARRPNLTTRKKSLRPERRG
jgi:uncharacterized repeat protein (TIGR01451 family)